MFCLLMHKNINMLFIDAEEWYRVFLEIRSPDTGKELQDAIKDLDLLVCESIANQNNIPY